MKRALFALSALCITAGALAVMGSVTVSTAAIPGAANATQSQSALLRHLSGVVAVPPETMMRSSEAAGLDKLWGPLNPPVFGPNVDASLNNSSNQNETTISIYPGDHQRVIASANDYRGNLKPWVYLSTNGGASWTNYQVPGTTNLFYGDPAMAFGPDHNKAYFSYLGYTSICSPMGGMYVSRSDDAGSTFTAPTLLLANTTNGQVVHFQDKEYVAVDKRFGSPNYRNAYIGWTTFVLNSGCSAQIEAPVRLSRSTDEGVSWSVPITVSPVISNNNQGVVPATGNNGEVYVYYVGAATQTQLNYDSVLFSRSTDGGQTFPFFTHISNLVDIPSPLPGTQFRDNPFGAMAVDRVMNGYLYAVWADYRNGDADILLSRSTDNGTTWGPPQRVNDDPLSNGKDQYFPWIASSDDGLVHITWHDEREDPGGAQYKAYYTYSSDHGATWATNIAVSTAPSNPGSSTFIGDYSGIDAVSGVVMPIWTDIRAGTNQNAYTARGVKSGQATATPTQPQPTSTRTSTSISTATRTSTPGPSITSTHGAFCPVTPTGASTSCTPPSTYDYSFQFNGTCTIGGNATLKFEVGTSSGGPWTTFDTQTFRVNFNNGANTVAGSLNESGIPSQYTWYRITISILMDDELTTNNATNATPICSTGSGTPTPTPTACTITFTDVDESNVFYPFIRCLACRGIISGYDDGTFRPFNDITRGQIAKIVSNAAGIDEDPGPQLYEDVPEGSPFYNWINRLSMKGHIGGYPCGLLPEEPCIEPDNLPYFRPSNSATRGQLAKIVANAAGLDTTPTGVFYTDVQEDHPFYLWIMRLTELEVMSGYDCGGQGEPCDSENRPYFRPYNNVTRGQASKIVANTFFPGCDTPARRR